MATWSQIKRLPFMLTRGCFNANTQPCQVKARAFSFYPTSRNHVPASDDSRDVNLGVTRDGETIVCFHPAPDIAYELTKPIPIPDPTLDTAETHDLVLKSQLNKDILKGKRPQL